ncbi:MAG: 1-deoxy-D-xylulose-5-phosphate synthase [Muribaculaceae bacterium]|nr:1-deoxy-D-xylulose-5-phosphate synthase [Muribaculaceae bacterium]
MEQNYPLLSRIDSPADLRKLSVEMLPAVCSELRRFLIESLSTNPGHFASSMGSVDFTVALHYVFDTPNDRIVWDVGHQAYGHKILTGRRDVFENNRKYNGLSGFPNPKESEYDSFIAGHASNSISAALGMSMAAELQGVEHRNVVAVIGDASISGGLAFEAMNNASINRNNLIILLNDNDMAIDQNVGAIGEYMSHLNTSRRYNNFKFKVYRFCLRHKIINEKSRGLILRFSNSLKALLTNQQNLFEGLNIRYFGPFDGHDVKKLVSIFTELKNLKGPRIIHLRTRKGKGYAPAEADPTTWHAPGRFDIATGKILGGSGSSNIQKYQDVFGKTLVELAKTDEKIVGITAAMPTGCSMTFMQEAFPKRAFDVGIAEEHAVTFSAGLAKDGMKPYCCIYSSFLQRAYDEIIHDVALQNLPVTFCIDRAGIVGEDGATHHGAFDLAYLNCIPNMTISSPYDEHMLRNLLYTTQQTEHGPFAIRYPRGKGKLEDWHNEMQIMPVGKGRKLADGNDVAVLTLGPIGSDVSEVLAELRAEGKAVAHYDMIFLKPLDQEIMREVGENYSQVLTVEDGTLNGGLGSVVTDWLNDNGYNVRVHRLGLPDAFVTQGTVPQLYDLCGIDKPSIKNKLKQMFTTKE